MRPDLAVELILAFTPFVLIGGLIYAASLHEGRYVDAEESLSLPSTERR